jgi:hypothetical protein
MRKYLLLSLACVLLLVMPAFAQEKEMANEAMPTAPPTALTDDLFKWMVGEWEGTTTSPMGKSNDWQKVEWALDNQYIIVHYTAKTAEANPEAVKAMAEAMKISEADVKKMQDMTYKGMGPMTLDPKTGEVRAMWFDNWRGAYKGSGKREGNKLVTLWEGTMGSETRTFEKVGEDKLIVTFQTKDATGKETEGRTELIRKKPASKT